MALKRWCSSITMAVFDQCGSTEVHDMDTVTSHLALPKATVGYYAMRNAGVEAIMAVVSKTTPCCAQSLRDARDATPPHADFTDLLTHVN
jgi:hypothetical protein